MRTASRLQHPETLSTVFDYPTRMLIYKRYQASSTKLNVSGNTTAERLQMKRLTPMY
jgi:hypothetical protein